MELRVLSFKAYKSMGPDELEDMAKQQFIFGVRNNLILERLIVHRSTNIKDAIEYGRQLEVANQNARGAASPNVKGAFAAFPTSTAPRQTNQTNNRNGYAFGQRENYQFRGGPGGMRTQTAASYSSGYVAPNGPPQRKPITCYTCGKLGDKSIECRSKPPIPIQSGNFVKGQWSTKHPDNTSNSKPKLPQSNMIVQSDEDDSESSDDGMVLTTGRDACERGILAVLGRIAGKEVEDLIVDTGSAVSLVSSQFYDTIENKAQLQPINGRIRIFAEY